MPRHQTRDAEAQCDRGVWVSKLLGAIHLPTDVVPWTTERGRNRTDWFGSRPRQLGGQQCSSVLWYQKPHQVDLNSLVLLNWSQL